MVILEETMIEYEKAQDSAEHYNTMTWTLTSIILVFSLIILKTILLDINSSGWQFSFIGKWTIISGMLLIGSVSWIYFGVLIEGANQKKKLKYFICQDLERKNKNFLGQNLGTKYLPFTKYEMGLKAFIFIKVFFMTIFLFLSFLVCIKAYYSNELIYTIILFITNLIIFIINIFYELAWRKRTIRLETILSLVKKEQSKNKRKN